MTNTKLLVMYAMVGAALSAAMVSYLDPTSALSSSPIPSASAAQVDYFLKIDGITGDSTLPQGIPGESQLSGGTSGWIELDSFKVQSTGATTAGTSWGYQFTAMDSVSGATPQVCNAYYTGVPTSDGGGTFVVLNVNDNPVSTGGSKLHVIVSIQMTGIKVDNYAVSGGKDGGLPAETFGFAPLTMQYTIGSLPPTNPTGVS
jgi:hypothetical protein